MKYTVVFILIMFASCNGQKKASGEKADLQSNMNPTTSLTLLLQDNYSGAETAETLVIKDAKTLKMFFAKINRTRKPGLPVPEVDFSKDMVIIYCGGVRKDNGLPKLSLKAETEGKMVFEPIYQNVQKGNLSSAATSPFCVYTIPFTDKDINFAPAK